MISEDIIIKKTEKSREYVKLFCFDVSLKNSFFGHNLILILNSHCYPLLKVHYANFLCILSHNDSMRWKVLLNCSFNKKWMFR